MNNREESDARDSEMNEAWGFRHETRPLSEKRSATYWFNAGWAAATAFHRNEVPDV